MGMMSLKRSGGGSARRAPICTVRRSMQFLTKDRQFYKSFVALSVALMLEQAVIL